ncbi:MAG TPA: patatin-like phospholipase family protein, partial [Thermoanaerobaculia bacterium]|nr:patatin-like phospholipase family protein [Thermoanaerobaculia bacterium]
MAPEGLPRTRPTMEAIATDPTAKPRVRALAFAGGGFDTARHLGVAHALLVARGIAPDYVAGISAGAINAAALAEVLQAGQDMPHENERRDVQIETFRKFLAAFEELPAELLRSMLPDAYELKATKPLDPIDLPVHFDRERDAREEASQARAGLIRLMNRLLEIRLSVSAVTWIANRILTFMGAAEEPSRATRLRRRARSLLSLWWIGFRHMGALGVIAWPLVIAAYLRPSWRDQRGGRAVRDLIGRWRALYQSARWLRDRACTVLFALVWALFVPPVALIAWA